MNGRQESRLFSVNIFIWNVCQAVYKYYIYIYDSTHFIDVILMLHIIGEVISCVPIPASLL